MHLGYISRWKTTYTLTDNGIVQMNLTTVDPVSEARRLQRILDEQPNTTQDRIELSDLIANLRWAINCPEREPCKRTNSYRFTIRVQTWKDVIANTDLLNLPIAVDEKGNPTVNMTVEMVSHFAMKNNLTWINQRGWLFGGYYRNQDGDCYYPC